MPYEFLEDEAIADIAFRAWGGSPEETFASAADATMNVMVEDLDSIRPSEERAFKLENDALDLLLFDLLQELIYYKDSEQLLLRTPEVEIETQGDRYILKATARGERLDPARHRTRVDVKAVTLHRFRVEKIGQGWEAYVILDV